MSLLVIHLKDSVFPFWGKTEGSTVTLLPWLAAEEHCINNMQQITSSASGGGSISARILLWLEEPYTLRRLLTLEKLLKPQEVVGIYNF